LKKRVSRHVSRPRPSLETTSLIIMCVKMLSLKVKLHKTQLAAEVAVGQGSVKVLREM